MKHLHKMDREEEEKQHQQKQTEIIKLLNDACFDGNELSIIWIQSPMNNVNQENTHFSLIPQMKFEKKKKKIIL